MALILKISRFFFLGLAGILFIITLFSFVIALYEYKKLDKIKDKEIKVSYEQVENSLKRKQEKIESQNEISNQQKNKTTDTSNTIDTLIDEINRIAILKGLSVDKDYLKSSLDRFKRDEDKINYLKGLKAIVDIANASEIGDYVGTYDTLFVKLYTERESQIANLEESYKILLLIAGGSFIYMAIIAIALAVFSIENNTRNILNILQKHNEGK